MSTIMIRIEQGPPGATRAGVGTTYTIRGLMEFTAFSAVVLAVMRPSGLDSAAWLMVMTVCLWARCGRLALAASFAAVLSLGFPSVLNPAVASEGGDNEFGRQILAMMLASACALWFVPRRRGYVRPC